jgi:PAS domain S-box-containing protein
MEGKAQTLPPDTQFFRDVFNASPIGIAVEDLEGQPLFVNPAFCSMLGFSEEELCTKHCVQFSPPEDAEKDWALFQQLRAGSIDHYQLDKRYFCRDGSLVWGRLSISLLKGRPSSRVIAMVENITDEKSAEQALRKSEARYRDLAEQSHTTHWEVDPQGLFTYVSHVSQTSWGYSPDEVMGRMHFYNLHPEEGREAFKAAVFAVVERKQPFRDVIHAVETKDGRILWGSTDGIPLLNADGTLRGYSGSCTDITERKRAEEALRISEERLRLAQQAARIGTFEWQLRTGVNTWTPELEAVYGLPPGGFGGTQEAFENLVHPDDRARVIELVSDSMKTAQPAKGEWRVVWSDGSVHWIAGRWQVFLNESGEPLRMIGVNIEITERKRAEEALLGVNRRLIDAQEQERTRIGRELHDDVSQRLAMLAVELKQLQNYPSEVENRVRKLLSETNEIANDVEALSHELHSSKLEYLGVVAGIRSWCKEFGERQNIEIDFRSDVATVLPFEIGICLFRVLQEALHNIVKHSGVKCVDVRLTEHSNQIHLRVSDSGKGFDVESTMQGKGLGLTSMRERVRLVNGTIAIESKPMGGTTIDVRVPLESQQVSQRAS